MCPIQKATAPAIVSEGIHSSSNPKFSCQMISIGRNTSARNCNANPILLSMPIDRANRRSGDVVADERTPADPVVIDCPVRFQPGGTGASGRLVVANPVRSAFLHPVGELVPAGWGGKRRKNRGVLRQSGQSRGGLIVRAQEVG